MAQATSSAREPQAFHAWTWIWLVVGLVACLTCTGDAIPCLNFEKNTKCKYLETRNKKWLARQVHLCNSSMTPSSCTAEECKNLCEQTGIDGCCTHFSLSSPRSAGRCLMITGSFAVVKAVNVDLTGALCRLGDCQGSTTCKSYTESQCLAKTADGCSWTRWSTTARTTTTVTTSTTITTTSTSTITTTITTTSTITSTITSTTITTTMRTTTTITTTSTATSTTTRATTSIATSTMRSTTTSTIASSVNTTRAPLQAPIRRGGKKTTTTVRRPTTSAVRTTTTRSWKSAATTKVSTKMAPSRRCQCPRGADDEPDEYVSPIDIPACDSSKPVRAQIGVDVHFACPMRPESSSSDKLNVTVPLESKPRAWHAGISGKTVSISPTSGAGLHEGTVYTLAVAAGAMVDMCGRKSAAIRCQFSVAGSDSAPVKPSRQILWDATGIWHYAS